MEQELGRERCRRQGRRVGWRRDAGYGTLDADNTATGHGAGSGGGVASGLLGFGKLGVQGPSAWEID